MKCVIIKVAATKEELKNPKTRLRRPNIINRSSFESTDSEKNTLGQIKKSRKKMSNNRSSVKKQRVDEIVKAFMKTNTTPRPVIDTETHELNNNLNDWRCEQQNADKSRDENADREGLPLEVNVIVNEQVNQETYDSEFEGTNNEKEMNADTESNAESEHPPGYPGITENDFLDYDAEREIQRNNSGATSESDLSSESEGEQQPDDRRMNLNTGHVEDVNENRRLISELTERIKKQENIAKKWKQEAILANAKLENQKRKLQHHQYIQPQSSQERGNQRLVFQRTAQNNENIDHIHEDIDVFTEKYHIGDNIRIDSAIYNEACDADLPSKFVTILSQAMWTKRTLSDRVVRKQANTGTTPELTPRKKLLLRLHYRKYLNNRGYSSEKIKNEIKNFNTYLGRAITSARKKLNLPKRAQKK